MVKGSVFCSWVVYAPLTELFCGALLLLVTGCLKQWMLGDAAEQQWSGRHTACTTVSECVMLRAVIDIAQW